MTTPTVLSPWYVVEREATDTVKAVVGLRSEPEFYTSSEDGGPEFTFDKRRALLFMSLGSAARVADATASRVRVLYNEEHAKEFDRG